MATTIAFPNVEANLLRKLGKARRTSSAQDRIARLQKEAGGSPGGMIKIPKKKPSNAKA